MEMQGQIQFLVALPLQLAVVPEREQPQPADSYQAEVAEAVSTQALLLVLALQVKATAEVLASMMVPLRINLVAVEVLEQQAVPVLALPLEVLAALVYKAQLAGLVHITLVAVVVAQVIRRFLQALRVV
jgi:hypothetical protein